MCVDVLDDHREIQLDIGYAATQPHLSSFPKMCVVMPIINSQRRVHVHIVHVKHLHEHQGQIAIQVSRVLSELFLQFLPINVQEFRQLMSPAGHVDYVTIPSGRLNCLIHCEVFSTTCRCLQPTHSKSVTVRSRNRIFNEVIREAAQTSSLSPHRVRSRNRKASLRGIKVSTKDPPHLITTMLRWPLTHLSHVFQW